MANVASRPKRGEPAWKTTWPRDTDLAKWFRCMLSKCDAIADDRHAADKAHLPIGNLAELGHVAEAYRHVNRFLRRLPETDVLGRVRMAELGATIALEADDLPRMEKYLAISEATEPFNTRKCDIGFSINQVRKFRARHGLLDPDDAVDEEQRIEASFRRSQRAFNEALAARQRKAAAVLAVTMEQTAHQERDVWTRQQYLRDVIAAYAKLGDGPSVKRCIRKLDREDREEILDTYTLMKLGMKSEAIARAKSEIKQELEKLGTMTDPNIHFPVMAICRAIAFLVEQGELAAARQGLRRALRDMPTWPVIEQGWTTSSVYASFAKAAALIGDEATANQLTSSALTDGKAEKRTGFRSGALGAALDVQANLGKLDEAIAQARKIRSPADRRKKLARLLAKGQRWKELREVFCQVDSPEEAADILWWTKFELPGGEVGAG